MRSATPRRRSSTASSAPPRGALAGSPMTKLSRRWTEAVNVPGIRATPSAARLARRLQAREDPVAGRNDEAGGSTVPRPMPGGHSRSWQAHKILWHRQNRRGVAFYNEIAAQLGKADTNRKPLRMPDSIQSRSSIVLQRCWSHVRWSLRSVIPRSISRARRRRPSARRPSTEDRRQPASASRSGGGTRQRPPPTKADSTKPLTSPRATTARLHRYMRWTVAIQYPLRPRIRRASAIGENLQKDLERAKAHADTIAVKRKSIGNRSRRRSNLHEPVAETLLCQVRMSQDTEVPALSQSTTSWRASLTRRRLLTARPPLRKRLLHRSPRTKHLPPPLTTGP